ncbi:MAG: PQQ-dependent sugar dehydrogenase, partial [Acidobacteria bacterium]|nr:PQQ-dependent sugar dehydrogenase [Acidobacteriota bacterium]
VELVAEGLQLPVAIEPVANPGNSADAPLLYVAELYGRVKVISRDGNVTTYADELLNFDPFGDFPGAGERGLADLAIEPETGDLFVTLPYHPPGTWSGAFQPRVIRLISSEDGREMTGSETVLDLQGEWIGPSHQIANISVGPDRKLYVHVADGNCAECARNPASARGKILRMELTGEPAVDNPFFDAADGITATDYIYALGFRNPFGGAWRAVDGHLYEVENGPSTDRFVRVEPGRDYGWEGDDENMFVGALYNWTEAPAAAPVNIAFVQPATFGGSGFPAWKQDTAYVTESGPTWATGQPAVGKRIGEFVITAAGELGGVRRTFVQYTGTGKSTVAALAAGPGGLYFSDLYQDDELESPVAAGAKIFRVRYSGSPSFQAVLDSGAGGCGPAHFRDTSGIPGIERWNWRFGDGSTSSDQNPTHQFDQCGPHLVELRVKGPEGEREKSVVIDVGPYDGIGLRAEYFPDETMEHAELVRIEPAIDYAWNASPIPGDEDGFSSRWRGQIRPRFSQVYQFSLNGSDGVRLRVDGRLVIDDWVEDGASRTGRIELTAGRQVPITIEARSSDGKGSLKLLWTSESQAEELVPAESLYPKLPGRRRSVRR